jgi:hypothetical protein
MPFNGSGTFSIVNTFVPNTTILSAAVNQNFTDIATGLSDCLTRDGQAGMTAAFKAIAGSLGAPGITFNSDATSGLYLPATGKVGLVAHSLGLLLDTTIYCALSATVAAGGSGYAAGDTLPFTGGTAITQPVARVTGVSGGAVTSVDFAYSGFVTTKAANPVSTSGGTGTGTGCTLNVTYNDPTSNDYRGLVTNESGALAWLRLGASSFISSIMAKVTSLDLINSLFQAGSGITINGSSSPPTLSATLNPTLVPNYISGLNLTIGAASNTFTVAVGVANDTTNVKLMQLGSSIAKNTASWVVGNNNGGLDTGAIATNTWYHVFLICRTDTGVVDVLFSTSVSSPTLPTNYTLKRRIASVKTDGSSNFTRYYQVGNEFIWDAPPLDQNLTGTTPSGLYTISTPPGVSTIAHMNMNTRSSNVGAFVLLHSPLTANQSATSGNISSSSQVANTDNYSQLSVMTDTSRQVRAITNGSGSFNWSLVTIGWTDSRGQ